MSTIMGYWDCQYCGTKGIKGIEHTCPNCGKARDEDTKFYMKGKRDYVTQEELKEVGEGPDWVCEHCGSLNRSDVDSCTYCGAKRTEDTDDYFQNRDKKAREEKEKQAQAESIELEANSFEVMKCRFKKWLPTVGIAAGIAAVFVLLLFLFLPKTEQVTIENVAWERSIDIESYQTVNESDWYLPSSARLSYTQQEFHHYDSVLDHYETKTRQVAKTRITGYNSVVSGYRDNGNGTFDEIITQEPIYETYYETETYQEPIYVDVPVYQTKYYYEIDKWVYERSVTTSGNDKNPVWGEVVLSEKERESTRTETYQILVKNEKDESNIYAITKEEWEALNVGDVITIKTNIAGKVEIIEKGH